MIRRAPWNGKLSRRTLVKAAAVAASGVAMPAVLAQSAKPIRIGNLNTYSGGVSYTGQNSFNGTQLYFDSVNWTVAGRKIEIIKEDDQFNPQVGLQKAKKLIESDKVDLLVGIQASNVGLAVLNYAKQQKAFYVISGAGADAITWDRYPYLFRTSLSTYQVSTPMAEYVYSHIAKEIVAIASDYAGGRDVIAQFKGPYVAKGGKLLKEFWPPLGTTDFSPYLTEIKAMKPPATYSFMPGADFVRFIQQYGEFGLKKDAPLTGFTIFDSQTENALGKALTGAITALPFAETLETRECREFSAGYRERFKSLPDQFADYGYVAAQALAEAFKATDGDVSNKDKLAEAMSKLQFKAPRGPFKMDSATHNPIQDIYICQVIEKGDGISIKILATSKDVTDPGKKVY